ncbi:DUF4307 domain-containing protein [Micrococcus sp. NPDC078436]|uniref:DUF4307 domain-containing protein n=1 Tax=unclassified Micrococcus TaxID=2620948 RepID=UPI0029BBF6B8|nr:DUF4307 domain-containing protein [Micrococcus sp. M4NT]MDX2341129.1 DUF4307 domain-containing protein [Micrococcus sp. M4NT]
MSSATPHAAHAQEPTLANRYGTDQSRPGRRRAWIALGVVAFLSAVALAIVIGLNVSVGRIESKEIGYEIVDDSLARVTFQVSVPEDVTAECDIVVMDAQAAPVGFRTVRPASLPADERTRPSDSTWSYTVDVRTVGRGVTGVVDTCRAV